MKLKDLLRRWRLALGKFLLDKKIDDNSILPPKSILFLRQDGKIGDYIVSSFVFREIKNFDASIKIGVVCTKQNAYLFEQNPYIDQLYFVKKKNIIDYIRNGLKIGKQCYDLVIDPTIMLRNRDLLFLRLIGAKNYLGYQKEDYKLFNLNLSQTDLHFSEIYRQALEKIAIPVKSMKYDMPMREKEQNEVIQFLQKYNIENYVAINFYGAARSRKFSDENITKILCYLTSQKTDRKIIILGYPDVNKKLLNIASDFCNVFVYDTQNIFHTIELIKHCAYLISPDTSTIHIASGFNKPIIGFYSQDQVNFNHWKPTSNIVNILFYEKDINEISPLRFYEDWFK
ncbi:MULTISPECIES: glycosyltransferase family 9 protein [unclassified Avibacterium]|uniref:glycosyltransferase family 9 protein n=1 Tax=unclassified Avibacterium TaxID=2685287 RepID=UPI0020272C40|nr:MULTISPECIES: glycosyltransferase family 9 protein [unclassified Avibacterium]MCW9699641.1 glycosyltransferase family 9 protein [Avibacterium sp. 20-129]URL07640.1 glycosyltransferase family 9 protein [Avibacterium sp. 21-595]